MTRTIKAVMVVAHPDDCVIFGWPIIKKYQHLDWTILYMTYDKSTPRGIEISKFWQDENVSVDFCGVEDKEADLISKRIVSFNKLEVKKIIQDKVKQFDLVVTHNEDGEYGHPHHVFCHEVVNELDLPKVFFCNGHIANLHIDGNKLKQQDLSKLPLHREIIEGFEYRYDGFYKIGNSVKEILK